MGRILGGRQSSGIGSETAFAVCGRFGSSIADGVARAPIDADLKQWLVAPRGWRRALDRCYFETVWTTLPTERALVTGSFMSLNRASS
jgi:hypothetical protein